MKIRQGFVSNSSSSSFIVKYKGDSLTDALGIDVNSPAYQLFGSLIEHVEKSDKFKTVKDYLDWAGYDDESELSSYEKDRVTAIKDGWTVVLGSGSNESYAASDGFFYSYSGEIATPTFSIRTEY